MSKDYTSPPAHRLLGPFVTETGAEDSLQAQNTYEIPDGAIAGVGGYAIFQFDKQSTATAVSQSVVVPAAGPGRWFLLFNANGALRAGGAIELGTVLPDFAVVTNAWTAFSGADFDAQLLSPLFTLTAASGRLVYNGPSGRTYEVAIDASIGNGESGVAIQVAIAVGHNGDVNGSTDFAFQQEVFTNATIDSPAMVRAVRHIILANGDTIDPMVKNITAGDLDLNVQHLVMTLRLSP